MKQTVTRMGRPPEQVLSKLGHATSLGLTIPGVIVPFRAIRLSRDLYFT